MKKAFVKIFDNGEFVIPTFKVTVGAISADSVVVNGRIYARKKSDNKKLIGRVIVNYISSDLKHMLGRSFPFYA